jgi:hypothetical protein
MKKIICIDYLSLMHSYQNKYLCDVVKGGKPTNTSIDNGRVMVWCLWSVWQHTTNNG